MFSRWKPPRVPTPCCFAAPSFAAWAGQGGVAGGVIVKAPKPGQERRVDLPTIGAETLNKAAEAGLAGVAVAAGRVLMAEPAATVAAANKLGLFLVGHALADDAKGDATKPG